MKSHRPNGTRELHRTARWAVGIVIALGAARAAPCADAATDVQATQAWKALEQSRWLQDGNPTAPRIVYMFTDPNCPYCNKLWTDARPWVDAGKVQMRHIVVGILTPTSEGKAATLLSAPDPARALDDYERGQSVSTAAMIASHKVHALDAATLEPLATIPPAIKASLDANVKLMQAFGLQATPAVVWKDAGGALKALEGVSPEDEARLFGPR